MSTTYASASRAAVQSTGGEQPSSVTPPETQLPSAKQTNPSLDSSNTRPSLVDAAAVAVTAADLRTVPRFTGSSDQNVPAIIYHFRVIVVLKAKRVRPNDGQFGDMVALENTPCWAKGTA